MKVEIRKTLPFHSLPSKPVFRTSVLVLNDAGGEEEDGNVRDVDDEWWFEDELVRKLY